MRAEPRSIGDLVLPVDTLRVVAERRRATVFGEVADLYDRARPAYPQALVDDVLAAAPSPPDDLERLLGAIEEVVSRAGGSVDIEYETILRLVLL